MDKHTSRLVFGFVALSSSALVPVNMTFAQERIIQDNKETGRQNYQEMIARVPAACVEKVQADALKACPSTCMLAVPNEALAEADSCDPRSWTCTWPEQAINETVACPAGWIGTYTQDRYVYVKECGASFEDTGRIDILSSTCVRERPDTKNEPCPTDLYGGHWNATATTTSSADAYGLVPGMRGGVVTSAATTMPPGVTSARTIYESYDVATGAITQTGTSAWVVTGVGCARDTVRITYSHCTDFNVPQCSIFSLGDGTVLYDGCNGSIPAGNRNAWSVTTHQVLTQQFGLNETVTSGGWSNGYMPTILEMCPPPPPNVVYDPNTGTYIEVDPNAYLNYTPGDGGGGGGGGGDDGGGLDANPFMIDMDAYGVLATEAEHPDTLWFGPQAGYLTHDVNANGKIDGADEMYGINGGNGYEELAAREDTNHDGLVNAKDKNWAHLQLWMDRDNNGESTASELVSLEEAGVEAIELMASKVSINYKNAFVPRQGKVVMKDGSNRASAAVLFTTSAKNLEPKTNTAEAKK